MLRRIAALFDGIEALWKGAPMRRAVAWLLVIVFAAAAAAIELERRGLTPARFAGRLPLNHFRAVELAFYLLLAFEVVGLVLGIARSVSNAAGKQFEIFSLILLRHAFEEFGHLSEPLVWAGAQAAAVRMLASAFGALLIFVVLGFYYPAQRHPPFSADTREQDDFVRAKKAIALLLLLAFAALGARAALHPGVGFFEPFYTVLVFADILLVLVSLRYAGGYRVVFRNSGLAVATVLLRLALSAPVFYNAALGLAAALFALGLTLAFNRSLAGTGSAGPTGGAAPA